MIIGVNLNHDYAYCVIDENGVFLNEIERESRVRHHDTEEAYTLALLDRFSEDELKGIDAIYLNSPKMRSIIKNDGIMSSGIRKYQYVGDYIQKEDAKGLAYGKIIADNIMIPAAWVSHYHAHAASSFWASPFEEADIVCLDGGGDYGEGAAFYGNKKSIVMTQRFDGIQLGSSYHHFSHRVYKVDKGFYESKVMAMASFGKKELSYTTFMNRNGGLNQIADEACISIHDIAEFQDQFEQGVIKLIKKNSTDIRALCCSGGCFLNVSLNRVIANSNLYDSVYIPPFVGDMGTAIGCALYANMDIKGELPSSDTIDTAFLGADIQVSIEDLKEIIERFGDVAIDKELYT